MHLATLQGQQGLIDLGSRLILVIGAQCFELQSSKVYRALRV